MQVPFGSLSVGTIARPANAFCCTCVADKDVMILRSA
jgi:hypothetical protein